MADVENITDSFRQVVIKDEVFGNVPLAEKSKNVQHRGTPVEVTTNMRKITVEKNKPIFKYAVQVLFVYSTSDGKEEVKEKSKSTARGPEHERNKDACSVVYKRAAKECPDLQKGGPFYYDRQASLYSLTRLKNDTVSVSITGSDISAVPRFLRAEFKLTKVADSFQSTSNDIANSVNIRPAQADKTILEALNLIVSGPALEDPNVLTIGNCVHYLYDDSKVRLDRVTGAGFKSSAVGTSKSIKTLEGRDKEPTLYMATELRTTLFHPDNAPLIQVFQDYKGFNPQMKANSPWALNVKDSFIGVSCYLNYGKFRNLGNERIMLKIKGFDLSAREKIFQRNGQPTSVLNYYRDRYSMTLQYPDLFTIVARGRDGDTQNIPVECLDLCNSQPVRTEQMTKEEQAGLIKLAAAPPHARKRTTDTVVNSVGLANAGKGFMRVAEPETVTGYVLPKPTIKAGGGQTVNWNDPNKKGAVTDFNIFKFFRPSKLTNWEVVFDQNAALDSAIMPLINTMKDMGMTVENPKQVFIVGGKLRPIFENASKNKRQLLLFITKSNNDYHQEIKCLEQEFDILTQDLRFETALRVPQQQNTRKNIVNKINMKLGGLNYDIESPAFDKNRLIIGFETSQKGGLGDAPIAIGFSANMSDHPLKFTGGYIFVKRSSDVYGSIVQTVVRKCLEQANSARPPVAKVTSILVYFSGITEGQYGLLNESYVKEIKSACGDARPHITVIAASKLHNTRLYKTDSKGVCNLEPGTVVDSVIVNPLLNEWYSSSAVARQGTNKATKYTLIFSTVERPLPYWECLTNDLCYGHQIVYHPVSLPVPLYSAGDFSNRGAQVLSQRRAIYNGDVFDFDATNKKFGVLGKKLFGTRFNA